MRILIPAAALLTLAPVVARAQTPAMQQPASLTLPVEVVKALPTHYGALYYERAGLRPREFRVGGTAQLTGAIWRSFKEGATSTKTVNGRTVTTGTLSYTDVSTGASCATNSVWIRAFLQFRATDPSGKVYISNVKGDSACVGLGG